MQVDFCPNGELNLRGEFCNIYSQGVKIIFSNTHTGASEFDFLEEHSSSIGGIEGKIYSEIAVSEQFNIYRETFVSEDKLIAGVKYSIENKSSKVFNLEKIIPFSFNKSEDCVVADSVFEDWDIIRAARNKNDIPGVFKPSVYNQDFKDALFDSAEVPAGMGVSDEALEQHINPELIVSSDPFVYIKNSNDIDSAGLFIAVLGQHEHLSKLSLAVNKAENGNHTFKNFEVLCEFDYIELSPSEKRSTHWTIFREGKGYMEAVDCFNSMLSQYYNFKKPDRPAPSLYCTWYFYGANFTEEDLNENLEWLQNEKIPFDIFLLDDGWSDNFGSWNSGTRFPSGMKKAAEKIKAAGYIPGVWTCPFVVTENSSVLKEHPELIARDQQGNFYPFQYDGPENCYTVDPTSPYAPIYFKQMYQKIKNYGFMAHKFDFLRSLLTTDKVTFYNKKYTRAQAYRLGMQLVREAIGDDGYILACGGIFEASIGLVDGMRTGSDTRGYWRNKEHLNTIKQNIMRCNSNKFWHTDPDAACIRLRSEVFVNKNMQKMSYGKMSAEDVYAVYGTLSLGSLNDEEAFTILVNQYIGGGMMCLSERFAELSPERKAMFRHVIPTHYPVPEILDVFNEGCPSLFLSHIEAECSSLGQWNTLAVANWKKNKVVRKVNLSKLNLLESKQYLVFEFKEQKFYGTFSRDDCIELDIPAHGTRLLRITPYDNKKTVIIGTDLHFSGGGIELADISIIDNSISGKVKTDWDYPVEITAAFPKETGISTRTIKAEPNNNFTISI